MKRLFDEIIVISLAVVVAGTGGYYAGLKRGHKTSQIKACMERNKPTEWQPKIGDRVQTVWDPYTTIGRPRVITVTNVVNVGTKRCQTGILVYGDGLPGVDSAWVKPAP